MIFGTEDLGTPGFLQEYSLPTSSAFGLSAEQAFDDNPVARLASAYQVKYNATGNDLTKEEALNRAKEAGVSVENIPEEGIKDDALQFIIDRQYDKKKRDSALAAIPNSGAKTAVSLAGGLAGSFIDPLNIASAFIPVVGEARYAAMLERAAGPLARLGVRAGVGAAEGAVGAAVLEPINFIAAKSIGDDYGMTDSLANIGFGALMGSALHAGLGAARDFKVGEEYWRLKREANSVSERIDRFSPEAKQELGRSALAQALTDKPIDVSPVVKLAEAESAASEMKIATNPEVAGKAAVDLLDKQEFKNLSVPMEERLEAAKRLDPEAFQRLEEIRKEADTLRKNAKEIEAELAPKEQKLRQIEVELHGLTYQLDNAKNMSIEKARELGARELVLKEEQTALKKELEPLQRKLDNTRIGVEDQKFYSKDLNKRVADAFQAASREIDSVVSVSPKELSAVREDSPTRFVDDASVAAQAKDLEKVGMEVQPEDAGTFVDPHLSELKEIADQAGVDVAPVIEENKLRLQTAKELKDAVMALATCRMRKG